jgi:hypothetical protein
MVDRKCTDLLFWLLFVASIGVYGFTVHYGYANGKPNELFKPADGDGKLCGQDSNKDFPNLYYLLAADDPLHPKAVCVKECPFEI